jgi:hypothetical protein
VEPSRGETGCAKNVCPCCATSLGCPARPYPPKDKGQMSFRWDAGERIDTSEHRT